MIKKVVLIVGCAFVSASAAPQEEIVIGYGNYQLSPRFNACMAKELQGKTFAQQELGCLKEELKDVMSAMNITYQEIINLMKKNHWKKRLATLIAAQKEFDTFVKHFTESTTTLYGSRMAGFAHYYEAIDFIELRHKHLQHLLAYYQGFKSTDHKVD